MNQPSDQRYHTLLQKMEAEAEAELLETLLSSVRKRKRTRTLAACFATAAALVICGITVTLQKEQPIEPDLAFSDIQAKGNWTEIQSSPQFTEVPSQPIFPFETISYSPNTPPQAVDEQGLIDLLQGRPFMISYANGTAQNQFWLLEKNAL